MSRLPSTNNGIRDLFKQTVLLKNVKKYLLMKSWKIRKKNETGGIRSCRIIKLVGESR